MRFLILLVFLTGCTIYQSPDRKTFESESPSFRIQSLSKTQCSNDSLQTNSVASRLVTILGTPDAQESEFLWEYIINNESHLDRKSVV